MRRLHLSLAAQRDLTEAFSHIAADNPDAAERLRHRLFEAATPILSFPELGRADEQGRRHFTVPGTKFRLIYRIGPTQVTLLRVWHGARQWPPLG